MAEKKTVIVTGGNGFIGTNLVRVLINSKAYRVVNLDAVVTVPNVVDSRFFQLDRKGSLGEDILTIGRGDVWGKGDWRTQRQGRDCDD